MRGGLYRNIATSCQIVSKGTTRSFELGGGANFECCVLKQKTTNPTRYAFKYYFTWVNVLWDLRSTTLLPLWFTPLTGFFSIATVTKAHGYCSVKAIHHTTPTEKNSQRQSRINNERKRNKNIIGLNYSGQSCGEEFSRRSSPFTVLYTFLVFFSLIPVF